MVSFLWMGLLLTCLAIADLADRYKALLMVDDSHAVGFMGEKGRGTHEFCGVMDRVDIMTGTLGKALRRGIWWIHFRAVRKSSNGSRQTLPSLFVFQYSGT